MKKIGLFITALLALLTSCNVNIDVVDNNKAKQDSLAIGFAVYVNRGVSTKAGETGVLTTDVLQSAGVGFGVFSYYGNGALYNETSKPDFMYNERVTYNNSYGKWDYHPIKYWPNEYGAEASSEAADRLSFFAYAPYVEVTPSTGVVTATGDEATTGIIGLSRNIAAGDPMVMYSSSLAPGKSVDLCWGVAKEEFTSSVDGNNNHVAAGSPYIDVIKPKTGDRLTFDFNHALAQLNVQIDADIDVESHAASSLDAGTHIYVRSVTFSGFTLRGSLNLNSNKAKGPAWYDISGTGRLNRDPVVVYDGRTDDLEAAAADVNELPAALNPIIIQAGSSVGVTNTTVNLFNSTEATAPVMVIPTTGVPMKVTIVYDIETADPSLPGYLSDGTTHGISIENTITKTVQTDSGNMMLEAGKKYVIGLHLGLTSVKFDATVADWDNTSYANTDLPVNTNSIGSVTLSATEATVWRNSSFTNPTVTAVTGSDGSDLTGLATIAWSSSDENVATVDEASGSITLKGPGTVVIKATATYEGASGSADFELNVNEVTAVEISTDPADAKAAPGGTITLTATLTHTNNGTIETWPSVSWVSGSTDYFTVDPSSAASSHTGSATTATTTATAVAVGSSTITVTVDSDFTSSTVSNTKDLTCESAAPTVSSFRGYEVSKGILWRDEWIVSETTTAFQYKLTDSDEDIQLAILDYYGNDESKDKYYHKWSKLAFEMGSDSEDNIDKDSDMLPNGWLFPGSEDWETIIFGAAEGITVNGNTAKYGYALVTILSATTPGGAYVSNVPSLLLIPDNTEIQLSSLEGKEKWFNDGGTDGDYGYDKIELSWEDYTYLVGKNCRFLPVSGCFEGTINNKWTDGLEDFYPCGYYWCYDCYDNEGEQPHFLCINKDDGDVSITQLSTKDDYKPVRLVKKIN